MQQPRFCMLSNTPIPLHPALSPNPQRSYHNHTSQYRVYSRYAYDGDNLRKHSFEYASFGDNPDERLEILELFKERKAYVTNLQTRACKVYNIPSSDSFLRHDIPDSAAFEGLVWERERGVLKWRSGRALGFLLTRIRAVLVNS